MRHSLLICLVLALGLQSISQRLQSHQSAVVSTVGIKRPNIVVRSVYLSKVEVWAIPTGTGITPDEYTLLGKAKRHNSAGQNEIWFFRIPSEPISATEIFAKGFDAQGNIVGMKSLPYEGASQIYDALWGERKKDQATLPRKLNVAH